MTRAKAVKELSRTLSSIKYRLDILIYEEATDNEGMNEYEPRTGEEMVFIDKTEGTFQCFKAFEQYGVDVQVHSAAPIPINPMCG
jgi:hypothetical protein